MIDINKWMKEYCDLMIKTFGSRIEIIGLQGSHGRGEAKEDSDIDVVLILDEVTIDDLKQYDQAISSMEFRELICGFVSGIEELKSWDKADLFQFCYDTETIVGSLDKIKSSIDRDDIRRAVHMGACNIYHGCVHNMVHDKSTEILRGLYKSARFVQQALYFYNTGVYIKKKKELMEVMQAYDRQILEAKEFNNFAEKSQILLEWSEKLVKEMRP